jgi:hypothetical protein
MASLNRAACVLGVIRATIDSFSTHSPPMTQTPAKPAKIGASSPKSRQAQERLAKALKANLLRRKAPKKK